MNCRDIEYMLMIDQERSITRAAEKLFLTQSALNQFLLKLEKELNTTLFHRSRNHFRPTEAGEIYLQAARKILGLKHDTYNAIRDHNSLQGGQITIGLTRTSGMRIFSAVYRDFHERFPHVSVEPRDQLTIKSQFEAIYNGEIDLAIVDLPAAPVTTLETVDLYYEDTVIVIAASHPLARLAAPEGEPFIPLDLKLLAEESFADVNRNSIFYPVTQSLFQAAGFTPKVLFRTQIANVSLSMIESGICYGIMPYHYIIANPCQVCCFLPPVRTIWRTSIIYDKNRYLSKASAEFIRMTREKARLLCERSPYLYEPTAFLAEQRETGAMNFKV